MATKLKSRSGCLTCLARKKKCDEALPKCSHCQRLGLACVSRDQMQKKVAVSITNLKNNCPSLRPVVSNGYPSFRSPLEQKLCLESPDVLNVLVSDGIADNGFKSLELLGRFCTQSRLVREATVAFAAFGLHQKGEEYYKLSLKSYQGCLSTLQSTRAYESQDSKEKDFAIIAIMFLGLLEALSLGDGSATLAHFEMCRKLLTSRLRQSNLPQDSECLKLYRMAAECVIYNFASLSAFHEGIGQAASDWGQSFATLFPTNDHTISPFLGGAEFQEIYRIMFLTNVLLRRTKANLEHVSQSNEACQNLLEQLDKQEKKVNSLYSRRSNQSMAKLYRAKYRVSIHALRIHLIKIRWPTVTPDDRVIRHYLSEAIEIIKHQEICEPWNPALRWPLTILACSAHTDADFELIMSAMDDMMKNLDQANSRRLQSAQTVLRRFRDTSILLSLGGNGANLSPNQLDFLLEPRNLDNSHSSILLGDHAMRECKTIVDINITRLEVTA